MQLEWNDMIAKYQAVHINKIGEASAQFAKGAKAVYFETNNFGWIILAKSENNRPMQRIFKY